MDQALDSFREFLRTRSLRLTSVRQAILKAALARDGHFSVDELVEEVKGQGIDASRATVYRSLPLLVQAGLLKPTVSSGERRSYEAPGKEHHDHLVCTRCSRVVEFQFEAFEVLQREVASKYGFELTGHSHVLMGICDRCRRPRRRS